MAVCQTNLIDVNFDLQKSLEILIKIQLTKSDPNRTKSEKYLLLYQLGLSYMID
jgi:hypothetical protein